MDDFTDYYAQLGVDREAQPGTIKAAFKKLALQYHPDVYKGEDAHERMRLLLLAYQTLNDPEARKKYDLLYAKRMLTPYERNLTRQKETSSVTTSGTTKSTETTISPAARRDRQRHYAFPDLPDNQPVRIDLVDVVYQLSSEKAQTLLQQGLLRGREPQDGRYRYYCHRCRHHWRSDQAQRSEKEALPLFCPRCFASDWLEYLLLRCIHCCAVFESEQLRYTVGTYIYGKAAKRGALCPPYELFPLCPYCGTARWCPAEDERVNNLRQKAARRMVFWRFLWIGIVLIAVVAVGMMAFGIVR